MKQKNFCRGCTKISHSPGWLKSLLALKNRYGIDIAMIMNRLFGVSQNGPTLSSNATVSKTIYLIDILTGFTGKASFIF